MSRHVLINALRSIHGRGREPRVERISGNHLSFRIDAFNGYEADDYDIVKYIGAVNDALGAGYDARYDEKGYFSVSAR